MLLIQNGNVYDPASGTEGKRDILTANGKIVLIRPGISREDILRFVSEPENDVNGAQVPKRRISIPARRQLRAADTQRSL